MKRRFFFRMLIVVLCLSLMFPAFTSAQVDDSIKTHNATVLSKLRIMLGDNSGNLQLDRKVTRAEFVTLVIRLMGWDKDTDLDGVIVDFADFGSVQQWAVNNMKIALKYGLIQGYNIHNAKELRPNNTVNTAEAAMILVRALGYESAVQGGWPDGVMNTASSIGLLRDFDLPPGRELTRGETAVIIYNSLSIPFKR